MSCEEVRQLMDGYLDGELELERNLDFEHHFETCPACTAASQNARKLRSAIQETIPYFRAPAGLEQRVRTILPKQTKPAAQTGMWSWRWVGAAVAVLLVVFVTTRVGKNWIAPSHDELIAQEIVSGHVRSLMANHLSDVISTDQHTVKPWFDGKLTFAPPVLDLSQAGFPLKGGRLDYVDARPVAALVYQRRLHYINLFVWPSSDGSNTSPAAEARQGYNILHWTQGGMTFWAVSDVSAEELQNLAALLRSSQA